MTDEEIIKEAKRNLNGDWQYFIPPSFLKILKRLIILAERHVKHKNKPKKTA